MGDADASRGAIPGGVAWKIAVKTTEDEKTQEVFYDVKVKGTFGRLDSSGPAPHTGESLLLRDGDMFFHKPGIKRPMVISASQRLMGPASNGDVSATNYAHDYDGKVVGEEKVGAIDCYKLDLKAKAGHKTTYAAVRYWVSKDRHLGIKAEFLTTSGEVFKIAEYKYDNKVKVGDKEIPFVSEMVFHDVLKPKNVSVCPGHLARAASDLRRRVRPAQLQQVRLL